MTNMNQLQTMLRESCDAVLDLLGDREPEIGIVLGSGLGVLAEDIEDAVVIPYDQIPHMKCSTVMHHIGRFVCGTLAGKCVIAMQGRLHGYEGYTPQDIAYPIWLMRAIGVRTLITTNAAGAINPAYSVGDFCIMSDHINLTGGNPIVGHEPNDIALRFVSMYNAYDPELRQLAKTIAAESEIAVHEGVYIGLLGPTFETAAEIRAFAAMGADTVAMSVIHEVIAARHVSMRVLGISLITNMACGVEAADPTDFEVFQVAHSRSGAFCHLITETVRRM